MSDLTGCYDRIVHLTATLALLQVGVPKTKVFSMFETIQKMVHRTGTACGESKGYFLLHKMHMKLLEMMVLINGHHMGFLISTKNMVANSICCCM